MNSTLETLAELLIHWTWRSALLVGAAGLVSLSLPSLTAATRHRLIFGGIIAAVVLPIFAEAGRHVPKNTAIEAGGLAGSSGQTMIAESQDSSAAASQLLAGIAEPAPSGIAWQPVVVWGWAAGCVLILLRLAAAPIGLRRLRLQSKVTSAPPGTAAIARALRLKQTVRFVIYPPCSGLQPATWGSFRPQVGLPAESEHWDVNRRQAVLAHELAHVKRGDYGIEFFCQLVLALQWWNPTVWLAVRRLRIERETACDDLVLGLGTNRRHYADALIDLASMDTTTAPSMAEEAGLKDRLRRIADLDRAPVPAKSIVASAVVPILPVALAVPLAWYGWADRLTADDAKPITRFTTVIIDPGHGGADSGAVAGEVREKDLSLAVARKLKERLEKAGVEKVVLTRADDSILSLEERVKIGNAENDAVFVSLHFSGGGDADAKGARVFVAPNDQSKELGRSIQQSLAGRQEVAKTLEPFRFHTIRPVRHPAVLIELAYLSHADDFSAVTAEDYPARCAEVLAEGIRRFGQGQESGEEEAADQE